MGKELRIDLRELCAKALEELQPEEDIDEALLRAAKMLHGKDGMEAMLLLNRMLESPQTDSFTGGGSKLEKVKEIAEGGERSLISIVHKREISHNTWSGGPDEVPPELLEKFPELRSQQGKTGFSAGINLKTVKSLSRSGGKVACLSCGYGNPEECTTCLKCESELKRKSFWDRLLGR